MSHNGIKGMQAAGQDLLDVAGRLTDEQWRAPSAAGGWSVQDVFIHVGSLFELLQAAVAGAESPPLGVEELNEMIVAQRRSWTPSETVQFLRNQLDAAVRTFTPLQDEPAASTIVPMLDLGSYPVHAIVDMFTFDLTTHLHFDVLAPRGPVPLPHALDDVRLVPSVAWLLGGIPQMQPDLARSRRPPARAHSATPYRLGRARCRVVGGAPRRGRCQRTGGGSIGEGSRRRDRHLPHVGLHGVVDTAAAVAGAGPCGRRRERRRGVPERPQPDLTVDRPALNYGSSSSSSRSSISG
ncbi:maleylpyruvate isomerase family mycothiol-dependent enzyme [Mycobacterium shigaense]|uniref:maleylpyruvate isomerase family mycothiol-dependent enzyme n=1 Tax=Mycobacterium shigaense TaxID=722731 RepID=UPI0013C2B478|nr:maleylpyruvate isomerase family mycothiol-dependent enzyme [Mycobacterium shigaense]MEA1123678.1 maleylpyruvate isomerase family mycothiol-dependent enzyme [Mycobacterium shigaense]